MTTYLQQLNNLKEKAIQDFKKSSSMAEFDAVEIVYLGRKNGAFTDLVKQLKDLPAEEKKEAGELTNRVKTELEATLKKQKETFKNEAWQKALEEEKIDLTEPTYPTPERGHFHPVTTLMRDLEDFFSSMGFVIADGPELESDYYNFTAVNIPEDHPARDMQDTFYIKNHTPTSAKASAGTWVMRTHTSSVQVRAMQKHGAPLRAIFPGKCFRNESTDVRHEHTFYQLEGVVIDKNINLSHLKGMLEATAKHLYGPETKVRLRPKFYPFVEPGVNGEVTCFLCKGVGCRLCKNTGWLEVLGAGMIHPNVLKEGGIDPNLYQGFAVGFGFTRLTMLKYGIDDVRLLQSGNLKFLKQF